VVELRYDQILGAVVAGEVDAGLIIHESRFTYRDHGLVPVADLGAWWERETGLPVPLAGICARADLDPELGAGMEEAIRSSVEYALTHPDASAEYVSAHAQELSPEVRAAHIELYVNDYSVQLDDEALEAIERLVGRIAAAQPTP
jgi:1,4-dihydroxy-6-naphthoate synthase